MSINLDKKYEKYLSKYNQLFTQINGGGLDSTTYNGYIYKIEPRYSDEADPTDNNHYYYVHVINNTVYLIEAIKEKSPKAWTNCNYTVEQKNINDCVSLNHVITDKDIKKKPKNIFKPEEGQLTIIPI